MAKTIVTASVEIHYPDTGEAAEFTPEGRMNALLSLLGRHVSASEAALIVVKNSAFYEPAVQTTTETPGAVLDPFTEPEGSAQ